MCWKKLSSQEGESFSLLTNAGPSFYVSGSQPVGRDPLRGSPDDLLGFIWDLQKFANKVVSVCIYSVNHIIN